MTRRIIAIAFIFFCSTVAWLILGTTIFARTASSGGALKGSVSSSWGGTHQQKAPTAVYEKKSFKLVSVEENGKTVEKKEEEVAELSVPLVQTRINADIDLDHRLKGLMWYSTYKVKFDGRFTFQNTGDADSIKLRFKFPDQQAVYDDVKVSVNGTPVQVDKMNGGVVVEAAAKHGEMATLDIGYRSQGLDSWRYEFGDDPTQVSQVKDFVLNLHTNFKDIDFDQYVQSPTTKTRTKDGWDLQWRYTNLVSGQPVGVVMPEKLQPGPLAGRISYFAPVSLFFFFFLMFIILTVRGINMHPMNYFFLAAAFFSFHLLLAYLVDHISIHAAFVIASLVSVALVVSYLRLVVDARFAMREAALTQILFLVLFSYAFFFNGFTGLAITIGSIITLFIVMQMTGKIRWEEKFAQVKKG